MSAAQVVMLAFMIPYYGRLVKKFPRMRLINVVTVFFIACLILFFVLAQFQVPLAIVFFLWIGIFNLMVVAQFWSFANDVYTKEEGLRLFVIVGFGASLGAVVGARVADHLIEPLGVYQLMVVGAVILIAQLLITNYIDRRESGRRPKTAAATAAAAAPKSSGSNAFAMVFRTRYLLLMGLMLMLLNWVNTTGEYILGSIVKDTATQMIASGQANGLTEGQLIGDFYSKYFSLVNVLGLHPAAVRRVARGEVSGHPMGGDDPAADLPGNLQHPRVLSGLYAVLAGKVAENSTDYSLNNTVRNMLFLPCTYEQKFSGKQAIDSFFVRIGDVLSAALVFVGSIVGLQPRGYAAVNAVIVLAWLGLAWMVGRSYQQLTEAKQAPQATV